VPDAGRDDAERSNLMLNAEQIFKVFHEKNAVQRRVARATFGFWQRLGFHVVGDHFYDPIPNTGTIREAYVSVPRELPAITVDWTSLASDACALMDSFVEDYVRNRAAFGYVENNNYFNGLDALYYYSFIRRMRPPRIIEIGQGFSTRIALAALSQNAGVDEALPELITIDPYSRLTAQKPTIVKYEVVTQPLQEIGKDIPSMLAAGDLLFIDSSHVFKFGSDVQLLFERIYPLLVAGVSVHIHDIFTPYDYPIAWMIKIKRFWNEQYFLESFLSHNADFRVRVPLHYLARSGVSDRMLSAQNLDPGVVRRHGQSLYLTRM
jgi:Methyltransferase domain